MPYSSARLRAGRENPDAATMAAPAALAPRIQRSMVSTASTSTGESPGRKVTR
ncbi:MAG: hypothetical protein U5Q44_11390 [Dehalococcoidia bacterium]|nr:hypothetical protein [Dehalococcoidia bacterium]